MRWSLQLNISCLRSSLILRLQRVGDVLLEDVRLRSAPLTNLFAVTEKLEKRNDAHTPLLHQRTRIQVRVTHDLHESHLWQLLRQSHKGWICTAINPSPASAATASNSALLFANFTFPSVSPAPARTRKDLRARFKVLPSARRPRARTVCRALRSGERSTSTPRQSPRACRRSHPRPRVLTRADHRRVRSIAAPRIDRVSSPFVRPCASRASRTPSVAHPTPARAESLAHIARHRAHIARAPDRPRHRAPTHRAA
ncbi:hypothetical protein BE221DRAFT_118822 [Ostreococcus tauri]|uniref:Uncharacterized protein n=1 Tax=Ostreococcus tauri TaxID=70448 RepID=A0A1Y5I1X6_OSTTA|nr:hypothetical protein BE221DRAFT_118822 [Ostreococcus tauri]